MHERDFLADRIERTTHGRTRVEIGPRGQRLHQRIDFGLELPELRMRRRWRIRNLGGERGAITARGQRASGVKHVLTIFQRLRGGIQLEREHVRKILEHLQHMTDFIGAHRHVVLGIRAGRNRIDRRGMRTRRQVVDQSRRRVLHDHESGIGRVFVTNQECGQSVVGRRIDEFVQTALADRREHGNRGLDVTHRERQRHAVEMPGRDDLVFDHACADGVGKNQRVVGDGVQFDVDHTLCLGQRIAHRAVHLRRAAQAVCVLRLMFLATLERQEARVERFLAVPLRRRHIIPADVEAVLLILRIGPRFGEPRLEARHEVISDIGEIRSVEQTPQIRCRLHLARMRAQLMHFGLECRQATGERIERHRGGEIGRGEQLLQRVERDHGGGEHLRRAVVERETLLERQRDRTQSGALQCLAPGHALVREERFALAQQHDRQMRQWRQITTRADRSFRRNHRDHAVIEQFGQRLQRRCANAGMSAHQRVDADCEHRAHHVGRQRFAYRHGMRDDQVVLQFFHQRAVAVFRVAARKFVAHAMRAEQFVGIAAEPRGDTVDRFAALDLIGEEIGGSLYVVELLRREPDDRLAARERDYLRSREIRSVELDDVLGIAAHRGIASACSSSTRKVFTRSARATSN